jgi:hypothetical protein
MSFYAANPKFDEWGATHGLRNIDVGFLNGISG